MLCGECAGDALAAEYVLLNLLSRVHSRPEPLALGALPLNLKGCPAAGPADLAAASPFAEGGEAAAPFARSVASLLDALLPRVATLPLTIEGLNTHAMRPTKNHERNVLERGALQLSPGTQLLVDETVLMEGKLTEVGVKNLDALKALLETQKLQYDFQVGLCDLRVPLCAHLPNHVSTALVCCPTGYHHH